MEETPSNNTFIIDDRMLEIYVMFFVVGASRHNHFHLRPMVANKK